MENFVDLVELLMKPLPPAAGGFIVVQASSLTEPDTPGSIPKVIERDSTKNQSQGKKLLPIEPYASKALGSSNTARLVAAFTSTPSVGVRTSKPKEKIGVNCARPAPSCGLLQNDAVPGLKSPGQPKPLLSMLS